MLIFTFQNNMDKDGTDIDKIGVYLDVLGLFCQQFGFWFWEYWNYNGCRGWVIIDQNFDGRDSGNFDSGGKG